MKENGSIAQKRLDSIIASLTGALDGVSRERETRWEADQLKEHYITQLTDLANKAAMLEDEIRKVVR